MLLGHIYVEKHGGKRVNLETCPKSIKTQRYATHSEQHRMKGIMVINRACTARTVRDGPSFSVDRTVHGRSRTVHNRGLWSCLIARPFGRSETVSFL